jgi:spermidine synthase
MTTEHWQAYEKKKLQRRMHYYNRAVHEAAFALPEFVRKALNPGK